MLPKIDEHAVFEGVARLEENPFLRNGVPGLPVEGILSPGFGGIRKRSHSQEFEQILEQNIDAAGLEFQPKAQEILEPNATDAATMADNFSDARSEGMSSDNSEVRVIEKSGRKNEVKWNRRRQNRNEPSATRTTEKDEEAMKRLWYKSSYLKRIPWPNKYPSYLKEPPMLRYEETESSIRRKVYNQSRENQESAANDRRKESKTKMVPPKMNKAAALRQSYARKEPLVSQFFETHFEKYQKPPFKVSVKCGN